MIEEFVKSWCPECSTCLHWLKEDDGEYDGECIGQRHFLELDGVPFIIGENNVKLYTPPDHYCLSFDRKIPFAMKPPEED